MTSMPFQSRSFVDDPRSVVRWHAFWLWLMAVAAGVSLVVVGAAPLGVLGAFIAMAAPALAGMRAPGARSALVEIWAVAATVALALTGGLISPLLPWLLTPLAVSRVLERSWLQAAVLTAAGLAVLGAAQLFGFTGARPKGLLALLLVALGAASAGWAVWSAWRAAPATVGRPRRARPAPMNRALKARVAKVSEPRVAPAELAAEPAPVDPMVAEPEVAPAAEPAIEASAPVAAAPRSAEVISLRASPAVIKEDLALEALFESEAEPETDSNEHETSGAEAAFARAEAVLAAAKAAREEADAAMADEAAAAERRTAEAEASWSRAEAARTEAEAALTAAESARSRADSELNAELAAAAAKAAEAEASWTRAEAARAEAESAREEAEAARRQVEAELTAAAEARAEAQAAQARAEATAAEHRDVQAAWAEVESARAEAQRELAEAQAKQAEAESARRRAEADLAEAEQARAEAERAEIRLRDDQAAAEAAKMQARAALARAEAAEDALAEAVSARAEVEASRTLATLALAAAEARRAEVEASADEAEAALTAAELRQAEANDADIEAAGHELAAARVKHAEAEALRGEAEAALAAARDRRTEAAEQWTASRDALDEAETAQADARAALRAADAQLAQAEATRAETEAALAEALAEVEAGQAARAEAEAARDSAEEARAEVETLRLRVEDELARAEDKRTQAQALRSRMEDELAAAELKRAEAEAAWAEAEGALADALAARAEAEADRARAEQVLAEAMAQRAEAEAARADAEAQQAGAEAAQLEAGAARAEAEAQTAAAMAARLEAGAARVETEAYRQELEIAQSARAEVEAARNRAGAELQWRQAEAATARAEAEREIASAQLAREEAEREGVAARDARTEAEAAQARTTAAQAELATLRAEHVLLSEARSRMAAELAAAGEPRPAAAAAEPVPAPGPAPALTLAAPAAGPAPTPVSLGAALGASKPAASFLGRITAWWRKPSEMQLTAPAAGARGASLAAPTSTAPQALVGRAIQAVRRQFLFVVLFSAAVNLLYLAPSIYMMQVYDRVLATGGLGTLFFVSVVLIGALLVMGLIDVVRSRILQRVSLRLDRLLSRTILDAAFSTSAGDPRSAQAMRDFDTVRQTATGPAAVAVLDVPWAPIYIGVCFLIHPAIGMLVVFGGAALLTVALFNERAQRRALKESGERSAALFASHEAERQGAEAVRALGLRGPLTDRHLAARADLLDVQSSAAFSSAGYSALTKFLRMVLQSAALGLGAYLAVQREVSPGAIIAATILTSRAFAPLEQVVGSWRQLAQAQGAWAAVTGLLDKLPDVGPRTPLPAPKGVISLEDIAVRAPGADRLLLRDVTARFGPGEIVGVMGPSGAGKSTLARVIAGAVPPFAGTVRIDGASFADWDPEQLARHMGYLPQDVQLFSGTVAENIARFQRGPDSAAKAVEAAQQAGAHEMILRLPEGYETKLGPMGRGLSFGQGQRIGLARALYGHPALLVLDEPNAHLDAEGEAALIHALKAAKERGATCVVVAHRPGVMSVADTVMIVRDGRLEAFGPRDQIVSRLQPVPGRPSPPAGKPIYAGAPL